MGGAKRRPGGGGGGPGLLAEVVDSRSGPKVAVRAALPSGPGPNRPLRRRFSLWPTPLVIRVRARSPSLRRRGAVPSVPRRPRVSSFSSL